ncbi:hypothetical protein PR202_ga24681 [Eleusine coracana subsp. coracana]|uniref:Uncharacterized protein n=1 Tax=Eleusine coracana subsp. coracana TaxID=191504 RepID=A0AAV5D9G0_ELECO|nr:hypothetical protein PR202_ga24681 [Eleusine coracana subsp. coracana]
MMATIDINSLAVDEPREVLRLAPLAPPLPDGGAVLALQATIVKSGGLALGVSVHHAACDGAASTHFLHTWATCCAGITGTGTQPPPVPPVIDRTLICDPTGLYDVFCPIVNDASKFVEPSSAAADDKLLFADEILQEKPACTTHTRFLEAAWSNLSLTVLQGLPGPDSPEEGPPM